MKSVLKLWSFIVISAITIIIGIGLYNSGRIKTEERIKLETGLNATKKPIAEENYTIQDKLKETPNIIKNGKPSSQQKTVPTAVTKEGIPVFTNESVPQREAKVTGSWDVYRQLQKTCNYWTEQWNENQKELSRVNMNVACRDSSNYARDRLNKRVAANYVAPQKRNSKVGGAILINGEEEDNDHPTACSAWKRQIETINARLRAGYKESTGNRLREKRRELSDLIHKHC